MTRKQIDQSREVRLWIGQIIVPALTLGATLFTIPEVRHAAAEKARCAKEAIRNKFKKD